MPRSGIHYSLLLLASGAAALIYEVLWLKELSRLFGATAHATSVTLAVFFLGSSLGGAWWGRRVADARRPLLVYARLELAIAATALLYFALLSVYQFIHEPVFSRLGYQPGLALVIKGVLAALILGPPAFFMGGTIPVLSQHLVRHRSQLGRTASFLYAANVVGATSGAFLAGFVLPAQLGFRLSYAVAVGLNLAVASLAWSLDRHGPDSVSTQGDSVDSPSSPAWYEEGGRGTRGFIPPRALLLLAAVSGFASLALEVVWTQMFAQVLQNSVYTFSAILTVFLAALAFGAMLANRLCRADWSPPAVTAVLLLASGGMVALSPAIFYHLEGGVRLWAEGLGWSAYIVRVFLQVSLVILPPGILLGAVFPFLMKLAEPGMRSAGWTVGLLAAVNTIASVVGSLAAGFWLLSWLGLWGTVRVLAMVYLLAGLFLALSRVEGRARAVLTAAGVIGGLVVILLADYGSYRQVDLDVESGEQLVDLKEGHHGVVAVVRRGEDLRIKANNSYLLGTSGSTPNLRIMSHLPLALHPSPRSVFYLGMGTGITAGGALDFPQLERVVVCELNEDVVEMSRRHFGPWLNGLYDDPRVEVLYADGRTWLASMPERYDLIIADIFLTYRVGVGALYTREHFETVRSRLAPGGIFAQWLTMFDLSEEEMGILVRSMNEVFGQVTVWRRGFSPTYPVFCLLASAEAQTLDEAGYRGALLELEERGGSRPGLWLTEIPLSAYVGNLSAQQASFAHYPLSTDDRLPLEYRAPITEREHRGASRGGVLAWGPLADWCAARFELTPLHEDPYLRRVGPGPRQEVAAGLVFYRSGVAARRGDRVGAEKLRHEFEDLIEISRHYPGEDLPDSGPRE